MKTVFVSGALALGFILSSSAAMADDPNDPAMRSAAARARDKEVIRQLNLAEARKVQARDARLAKQWREWREYQDRQGRDR
ncbi:MAG: hypothetical protein ACKOOL_11690 [Novosphingobium sp.]